MNNSLLRLVAVVCITLGVVACGDDEAESASSPETGVTDPGADPVTDPETDPVAGSAGEDIPISNSIDRNA